MTVFLRADLPLGDVATTKISRLEEYLNAARPHLAAYLLIVRDRSSQDN
jgi:hypothetical protein